MSLIAMTVDFIKLLWPEEGGEDTILSPTIHRSFAKAGNGANIKILNHLDLPSFSTENNKNSLSKTPQRYPFK